MKKTGEQRDIRSFTGPAWFGQFSLFAMILFFGWVTQAQVKLEATIDRNQVNEGDALTLTVAVTSDQPVNVQQPRLPTLQGFQLINSWTGTEARSTFTNGKFETIRTRKYNFQLTTPQKGDLRIEPIEVVVDGKTYKTQPIDVKVFAGGAPSQQRGRGQDPFSDPFFDQQLGDVDDLFNQLLGRNRQDRGQQRPGGQPLPNRNDPGISSDVSIQVEVDKRNVYVGEQITASWYLYTQGQIRDIDTLNYPSLSGFWKEDIEIATHLNFRREVVNGVVMKKALLASYALFAIKPGPIEIDPYQAKITSVATRGNFGFGFGRPQVKTTQSRVVPVEVKPLPEPKPENFVGAVGNYRLTTQLDTQTVTVNQPFTLKVRFDGIGNAKTIDQPQVEFPGHVELYDTKSKSQFFKNGQSFKEFEILMIPREPGMVEIPGLKVSIFEPKSGQYVERKSDPMRLMVHPSKGDEMIPSSPIAEREEEEAPAKDRLPSEVLTWGEFGRFDFLDRAATWSGVYLALFFGLFMKARQEFGWGQRLKSLSQVAHRRFSKVKDLASQEKWREVGVETTNAVYFVLGEISGEGGANVEVDKLIMKAPPSVRRELGEKIESLLDSFQILSFAPEEVVGSLKSKDKLLQLVKEMEEVMVKAIALGVNADEEAESAAGKAES